MDNRTAIYCLNCGGHVLHPGRAEYRVWSEQAEVARPRSEPCECGEPLLFMPWRTAPRDKPRQADPVRS